MKRILLIFSALWRLGYLIDSKTRLAPQKNVQFKTMLLGVGSLFAGGAGKTPFTAFLAEKLKAQGFSVAILCKDTGDENLWFKNKGFDVFTGNRFELCKKLDGKYDILISDDGLEDKRLCHAIWICLTWGERANSLKDIIPYGNCRSLWRDHSNIYCVKTCAMEWENKKADIIFSMKTPVNINNEPLAVNSNIIAIAGIARSYRFFLGLQKNYSIIKKIDSTDHSKNIQNKTKQALKLGFPVVLTEKDAVKLSEDILQNENLYICSLSINN